MVEELRIGGDGELVDPAPIAPRERDGTGRSRQSGLRPIRSDGTVLDTMPLPECRSRQSVPPSIMFSRGGRQYDASSFRAGDLPRTLPVVDAIAVDDQGRLWICRTS